MTTIPNVPPAGGPSTEVGNLGAAYTLDLGVHPTGVTGTLNANCTVTCTNWKAGQQALLIVTQDATGGRTLSVSDGTNTQAVPIPTTAGTTTTVQLDFPDVSTIVVTSLAGSGPPGPQGEQGPTGATGAQGPQGTIGIAPTVVTASGSVTVPANAGHAIVTCVGGGGGGSGANTSGSTPGNGGGAGGLVEAITAVSPGGTLTAVVGAGGAGGAANANGSNGGTTSVTGTGVSVTAVGGGGGGYLSLGGGNAGAPGQYPYMVKGGYSTSMGWTNISPAPTGAGGVSGTWPDNSAFHFPGGSPNGLVAGGGGGGFTYTGGQGTLSAGGVAGSSSAGNSPATTATTNGTGGGGGGAGTTPGNGGGGDSGAIYIQWLP